MEIHAHKKNIQHNRKIKMPGNAVFKLNHEIKMPTKSKIVYKPREIKMPRKFLGLDNSGGARSLQTLKCLTFPVLCI